MQSQSPWFLALTRVQQACAYLLLSHILAPGCPSKYSHMIATKDMQFCRRKARKHRPLLLTGLPSLLAGSYIGDIDVSFRVSSNLFSGALLGRRYSDFHPLLFPGVKRRAVRHKLELLTPDASRRWKFCFLCLENTTLAVAFLF